MSDFPKKMSGRQSSRGVLIVNKISGREGKKIRSDRSNGEKKKHHVIRSSGGKRRFPSTFKKERRKIKTSFYTNTRRDFWRHVHGGNGREDDRP